MHFLLNLSSSAIVNEHQQAVWITRLLSEIYNIKICAEAILLSGVDRLPIFNQNTHLR